jgi:iron complex transport system permease protein
MAVPCLLAAFALGAWFARDLDLLLEGDETARALGVDVERVQRSLMLSVSLLSAAAVATSGVIGFVGLVVPHMLRPLIGPAHARLYPASALTGAWLLVLSDLTARTIHWPEEIQLGIVTASLGAPLFLFLLLRQRREYALL